MQVSALCGMAAMLIARALAQNTTGSPTTSTSAPATTTTDLASLVSQLPKCALDCLQQSANSINCTTSDLPCLCSKSNSLVAAIAPCILTSSCSSDDQSKLTSLASEICNDVSSADTSQIAAASSAVNSAIASASSTASGNLAVRTDSPIVGMGVMGAAAALAALAL